MLFRKCKQVIEYEEDEASFYLTNSVFNFLVLHLLKEALLDVLGSIVSLIELDMRGRYQQIEEDKNTDSKGGKLLMEVKYIKIEHQMVSWMGDTILLKNHLVQNLVSAIIDVIDTANTHLTKRTDGAPDKSLQY